MDGINFFASINKLSLFAFFLTLGILIYEVILFKKEAQQRTKPKIPNFQESINPQLIQAQVISSEKSVKITKPNNLVLIISVILVFLFGLSAYIGFSQANKDISNTSVSPTPIIDFISSKGIKIFNKDFQLVAEDLLENIIPGEEIIIGVETIPNLDIDRARIRVNKEQWDNQNITLNYSDELKVYYINYIIASDESKLKIEAQLHSLSDGWLGD